MRRFNYIIVVAVWGWMVGYPVPILAQDVNQNTTNAQAEGWRELFRVYWGTGPGQIGREVREGSMSTPTGLAVDKAGNIHLLDYVNRRIAVFSQSGEFIRNLATESGIGDAAQLSIDSKGNLLLLARKARKNYSYQVYSPSGAKLKSGVLPQNFNSARFFVAPNGKTLLWANEARYDKQLHKMRVAQRGHYQLGDTYDMSPAKSGSIGNPRKAKVSMSTELELDDKMLKRSLVFRDAHGRVLNRVDGEGVLKVDAKGRAFRRSALECVEMIDSQTGTTKPLRLVGQRGHGGEPTIDDDGNVYQVDLIPNVSDAQIKSIYPPPSPEEQADLRYDLDSPGIRILKHDVNE